MKLHTFTYFLYHLQGWFLDANNELLPNDISVLKALKLLFLTTAAEVETHDNPNLEKQELLLSTFNDFRAFPLGHVEMGIYEQLKASKGETEYFKINNATLTIKRTIEDSKILEGVEFEKVDRAIKKLKEENKNLIRYSAYQLVELTHKWDSWKFFYTPNSPAGKIPPEVIISEPKFFK